MGSDNEEFFKKRKGQRKKKQVETKQLAPYRYLIVSEGKETETNYFEGIKRRINSKYSNRVELKQIIRLDIEGTGRNTNNLIEFAEKIVNRTINPYGHIWVIFDKDDFTDDQFNSAILQAKSKGFYVGWSNEAFELWFLLHFEYLNTGITRDQYNEKLTQYFNVKEVFKKYIEDLDPDKFIFLQKDIDGFKKYETKIDDEIHGAKLESYYAINNLYVIRLDEIIKTYGEILYKPFSFNTDETIVMDGDKRTFAKTEAQRYDYGRKRLKYLVLSRYSDMIDEREKNIIGYYWQYRRL